MFSTDVNYEIVVFSVGDTKAGTKMGKLQLKNPNTGALLNCILWEETLNRFDAKVFRSGNIVRIVTATFNEKFNNCLVSSLELVKEAILGLDEAQTQKVFDSILAYVNNFTDEKLKMFLLDYLAEHEEAFKITPAAKVMHHNYLGGLLVHTLECLEYAKINMDLADFVFNRDEVYAACILHDIGKIFEYKIDTKTGLIDYAEDFKKIWSTHSLYGFSLCMNQGFTSIARMIAAHHGRTDWGAIIDLNERDIESELYFLHLVDNLSAKFGKINVQILEKKGV